MEERKVFVPSHRRPTSPGEILLEEFLKPNSLESEDIAKIKPIAC